MLLHWWYDDEDIDADEDSGDNGVGGVGHIH